MQKIAQGAEAVLYKKEDSILKERISKGYRIAEIDKKLRKERTKTESKLLSDAKRAGVPCPQVLEVKDFSIEMQFIDGKKLKDILDSNVKLSKEIGENVAKLHSANIIHGDLTTSNMIFLDKIYFIDFGLGFFSERIEDRAMDLTVFRQAIKSTHFNNMDNIWKLFLEGYSKYERSKEVLSVLDKIEKRGRYKKTD